MGTTSETPAVSQTNTAPALDEQPGTHDSSRKGRSSVLDVARAYVAAGLCVTPVRLDGSKRPMYRNWQSHGMPTLQELEKWFADGKCGIGLVCGSPSGGLEVIDFDHDAESQLRLWFELVDAQAPGLRDKLCVVRTPRRPAGYHCWYRCPGVKIGGNTTLAETQVIDREGKPVFLDNGSPKLQTLIETRGQGGQALAPGCPPECHETRGLYQHSDGPRLTELPAVTAEEREMLLALARSLDRTPASLEYPGDGAGSVGDRPGDDFGRRGPDWSDLLEGWECVRQTSEVRYWRRPGKRTDWSATTGHCKGLDGTDRLYVFSTNASPFQPRKPYSKFAAYATLKHGGDYAAAARDLADQGYGGQRLVAAAGSGRDVSPLVLTNWPQPPDEPAYCGLAGKIVRLIEPASEADPAALLVQTLVAFGNAIGRGAHFVVESDRHFANEFAVLVGRSSKARKGTSWGRVSGLFRDVDPGWLSDRIQSGLSSGEGLIWSVRDPDGKRKRGKADDEDIAREDAEADAGATDKRLLVYEPEFANVLKQTERQGNTLSAALRQAWDGQALSTLTKNAPARSTDAHVSLIGHITTDELRRYLTVTETANGFGNRHLWLCADRSKLLPEGGQVDPTAWSQLAGELVEAVRFAQSAGVVARDDVARRLWCEVYADLSEGWPGLAGSLLGRGEAHVMRLAMIYALLDRSAVIRAEHLQAALALWRYVERSVCYIFGNSLGDPVADEVLRLLTTCPGGLTRNELRDHFGRHLKSDRFDIAMNLLLQHRLARFERQETAGRPAERWFALHVRKAG